MKSIEDFKFNLGDEVKDSITGFLGIVVSRSQWLNCCNTYSVQPTKLVDEAPQKSVGFDEPQLVLTVSQKVEIPVLQKEERTGGPERTVLKPGQ